MLYRIVDVTLETYPSSPSQLDFPPELPDFEPTGPERPRNYMHRLCMAEPFHYEGNDNDIAMQIALGHSTPNTHVDVFLHDWDTMYEDLPRQQKKAIRSSAQVPVRDFVGFGSLVDVSDIATDTDIDLETFKSRASHVQPGDIVFVRTGHPEKKSYLSAAGQKEPSLSGLPLISQPVARWLVEEKRIKVYGHDAVVNGNFRRWMKIEQYFYRQGVLMIDRMAHLHRLREPRFFTNVGVVFKMHGVDDSPARVIALEGPDPLRSGRIVELFDPMTFTEGDPPGAPPYPRQEPAGQKSAAFKTLRVTPCHLSMQEYELDSLGWITFKVFSNRLGTHLDAPFADAKGSVPADKVWDLGNLNSELLCGPAAVINAWEAGPGQNVTPELLERQARHLQPGDIAVIRTGFSDQYYHQDGFFSHTPGFTPTALRWLIDRGTKLVVTDAATVEDANALRRTPTVRDGYLTLATHGIGSVLLATNLWRVRKPRPFAFVSPMMLSRINASPARTVIVEKWVSP